MKKLSQILLFVFTTSILVFALSGCGKNSAEKGYLSFMAPIDGWADITIPEKSTFIRTNISGKVENHEYMTPLISETELLLFAEKAMEEQGWVLESSLKNGRNFIKNGDHVELSAKTTTEEGTPLFIVIEPEGVYGPPKN